MTEPHDRPTIGEEGVRRIADLARLHVGDEEIPALARHFERMLDFVEKLEEVDVEGVEPELHPSRSVEALRSDELREASEPGGPLDRDRVLENAPEAEGPFFSLPRVIE